MQCTPKTNSVTSHSVFRRCRWNSIFLPLQRFVADESSDYFLILGRGIMMRCSRWPGSTASNLSATHYHTCIWEEQTTNQYLFIALLLPPCNDRWPLESKRTHQTRPRNYYLSFSLPAWYCRFTMSHWDPATNTANTNGRSSLQIPELPLVTGSPVRQLRRSFPSHGWTWLWRRIRMHLFQDCWEPWLVLQLYVFLRYNLDGYANMGF